MLQTCRELDTAGKAPLWHPSLTIIHPFALKLDDLAKLEVSEIIHIQYPLNS